MPTIPPSLLQALDPSVLTAVVRQSLGRETFQIRDWHASQMGGGVGNPVSFGLFRFEGSGQDRGEQIAWSVILKILQSPANVGAENMGEGEDLCHWNYWKREPLVYQSGFLETLPQRLVAPRYFGVQEQPGNIIWLWLEDIVDADAGAWSLERFALTARRLGQFNGSYAGPRPLPTYPWLGKNLTQQWGSMAQSVLQNLAWDDPRVRARYPRGNSFQGLLYEQERFQAGLNLIPRTVCHGDTYPTNFMARRLADGQEETVALDWALVNIGPVGDDLGQLLLGAHMFLKDIEQAQITERLFNNYLDGLRESGCQLDSRRVRFGFAASAALRVGMFSIFLLSDELRQNQAPEEEVHQPSNLPERFEVSMANEAFQLLDLLT